MGSSDANAARARQLLHTAADAAKQLEESVRELVTMRAWDVLGYENFSEMWEKENGFACPSYVKILATNVMMEEGMNSRPARSEPNGHRQAEVAEAIGYPVRAVANGGRTAPAISALEQQRKAGVPVDKQTAAWRQIPETIRRHGTRARQQPRRMGKAANEKVNVSIYPERWLDDAISEAARKANVSKSEMYIRFTIEGLHRINAMPPQFSAESA